MTDITEEVIGGAGAYLADRAWTIMGEPLVDELDFIEHHHVGLSAILAGQLNKKWRKKCYGAGVTLIALEVTRDKPFNLDNPRSNALTLLLLGANLMVGGVKR